MFEKFLNIKTKQFLAKIFKETDDRNSILDPLTCLVRLAILSFKPQGTKISVSYNSISYNEPGLLQGILRWTYGDNREDLHNLFNPIKKVIEWYNLALPEIRSICEFAIKGINVLMTSYNSQSIICHSLEHYIHILELALSTSCEDEDLTQSKYFMREQNGIIPKKLFNSLEDKNYNKIYINFRELWSEREVSIVYNLLLEMSKLPKEDIELMSLTESLNSILVMKETKVRSIIVDASTILE